MSIFNRQERDMWVRGDKASALKAHRDRIKPMPSLQEALDAGNRGDCTDDMHNDANQLLADFHGIQ